MSLATDTSKRESMIAPVWLGARSLARRILHPGRALLVVSLLLPALVFALASWQNRRDLFKQAETRIHRTLRTLNEHAVKVFETHTLVINQINERLRSVHWDNEEDKRNLHELLRLLQEDFEQVATVTITDAKGNLLASSRSYPADPKLNFADRDWFRVLKTTDAKLPYVSASNVGRQSGQSVFNIAGRVRSRNGAFDGVIAVSVDRSYFEKFYRQIEPQSATVLVLLRRDGEILARQPIVPATRLPADATFYTSLKWPAGTIFEANSTLDGLARLFAYQQVGRYPVYIGFGLSRTRLLAIWQHNIFIYACLAAAATLALLGISALALRQMARERLAVQRWRTTASKLREEAAERERVEAHLRQSQKMEAVGQLTSGIAHDFNNMLGAVIASLDLLRVRLKRQGTWNEGIQRHVENAMEGAWRAASLTQRLLAFSRKQVLSPSAIELKALVEGMADLIRRTIDESIGIDLDLEQDAWLVYADANQLENAILNLVVNARDAMGGGGRLTLTTRNRTFAADVPDADLYPGVAAGDYVLLAVHDTGSGMSSEVLARAFDPFFTTKEVGKGTGLGLSQVQGFVEQSRGYVKAFSQVDHGTTVEIYLPRMADTARANGVPAQRQAAREPATALTIAADEPVAAAPAQRPHTVLVVEDDPQVRRVSKEAFGEMGFSVLEAAGADAALTILEHQSDIVLLFTDVVMPGINGPQLAERVRRTRPDIKVLFTTGYAQETLVSEARMDPHAELITKPYTLEELKAKVENVLGRAMVIEA